MDTNNRIRYTVDEVRRNLYYQLPKFLFEGEFVGLTNDARVLYALLRDRHDLSVKNRWINEKNEVYLVFSREKMCEMLKLSKPTITKAMNDLKKYNLIDETRLGQGKPNRIYLLMVDTPLTYGKTPQPPENTEKERNFTSESQGENPEVKNPSFWNENSFASESQEILPPDAKNFSPINTDTKKTSSSETEETQIKSNQIESDQHDCSDTQVDTCSDTATCSGVVTKIDVATQPTEEKTKTNDQTDSKTDTIRFDEMRTCATYEGEPKDGQENKKGLGGAPFKNTQEPKPIKPRYKVSDIERIVKHNINYDCLLSSGAVSEERLDEIVSVIVHTICNVYLDGYITMGKERVFAETVRSVFFKLTAEDIEYFLECFDKVTTPITSMIAYIRKSLFFNHSTIVHYYRNLVYVHMPHLAD